jgi:hypothetical protein
MSKFNLKNHVKKDGDEHTDKKLREEHEEAVEEITEEQLSERRVNEKETLIEDLLEEQRKQAGTSEADIITEGNLDSADQSLHKHRNPEAYEGDVNKLEEQRLSEETQEEEEYELASETKGEMRWWEDVKDGKDLKLASDHKKKVVEAQSSPHYDGDNQGEVDKTFVPELPKETLSLNEEENDDFEIDDRENIKVTKQKDLEGLVNGVYMALEFNPYSFSNDKEAREAVFNAILSERPELEGLISKDEVRVDTDDGTATLRSIGDQFLVTDLEDDAPSFQTDSLFREMDFNEVDLGGTPTASGSIEMLEPVDMADKSSIAEQAVSFINSKHPEYEVSEQSLDLSNIGDGMIGFMASPKSQSSDDFDIIDDEVDDEVDFTIEDEIGATTEVPLDERENYASSDDSKKK